MPFLLGGSICSWFSCTCSVVVNQYTIYVYCYSIQDDLLHVYQWLTIHVQYIHVCIYSVFLLEAFFSSNTPTWFVIVKILEWYVVKTSPLKCPFPISLCSLFLMKHQQMHMCTIHVHIPGLKGLYHELYMCVTIKLMWMWLHVRISFIFFSIYRLVRILHNHRQIENC